MASEESETSGSKTTRSYTIMKADTQEALELAKKWWSNRSVPSYVSVRRLDKERLTEFVEVYNRCFIASPDPFCPLTNEQAAHLDTEGIFIADLWGQIAGFIACFVERRQMSVFGEITGIGVLPSRRRRGIATALIQRAVEYFLAAGVDEVYCEVYEKNIPSQMLILAYGFKEVGRRSVPIVSSLEDPETDLPGGKIMRRLGLRPRPGCEGCRDL
ncbi:MAG: GNAT family N-acetyltransferase [Candidatus Thorarchaeota archaeon]|nr:GNAT family N-acetyltransferase [Candidatus Thorarchaeota archaeon]